ncbi:hypothetical protein OV450_3440 [Actinobacteria bacterium OV450]|nr:hypothetical protein OV450_3440 [Actinobacteria bacterium OV450]
MGAGVWPELPERRAIGTVVLYARGTEAHEMIRCFEAGTITPLFVKLLRRLNEPPTDRLQVAREIVERTAAMIESQMLTDEPERARWRGWWKRNEP